MRATIITLTQAGAGRNSCSTTTITAQIGRITTRWRSTVRQRQPASVSSCRTQCTFSGGSRNPRANLSQRSGPGSPGSLLILGPAPERGPIRRARISVCPPADGGARGDRLPPLPPEPRPRSLLLRGQRPVPPPPLPPPPPPPPPHP